MLRMVNALVNSKESFYAREFFPPDATILSHLEAKRDHGQLVGSRNIQKIVTKPCDLSGTCKLGIISDFLRFLLFGHRCSYSVDLEERYFPQPEQRANLALCDCCSTTYCWQLLVYHHLVLFWNPGWRFRTYVSQCSLRCDMKCKSILEN